MAVACEHDDVMRFSKLVSPTLYRRVRVSQLQILSLLLCWSSGAFFSCVRNYLSSENSLQVSIGRPLLFAAISFSSGTLSRVACVRAAGHYHHRGEKRTRNPDFKDLSTVVTVPEHQSNETIYMMRWDSFQHPRRGKVTHCFTTYFRTWFWSCPSIGFA